MHVYLGWILTVLGDHLVLMGTLWSDCDSTGDIAVDCSLFPLEITSIKNLDL